MAAAAGDATCFGITEQFRGKPPTPKPPTGSTPLDAVVLGGGILKQFWEWTGGTGAALMAVNGKPNVERLVQMLASDPAVKRIFVATNPRTYFEDIPQVEYMRLWFEQFSETEVQIEYIVDPGRENGRISRMTGTYNGKQIIVRNVEGDVVGDVDTLDYLMRTEGVGGDIFVLSGRTFFPDGLNLGEVAGVAQQHGASVILTGAGTKVGLHPYGQVKVDPTSGQVVETMRNLDSSDPWIAGGALLKDVGSLIGIYHYRGDPDDLGWFLRAIVRDDGRTLFTYPVPHFILWDKETYDQINAIFFARESSRNALQAALTRNAIPHGAQIVPPLEVGANVLAANAGGTQIELTLTYCGHLGVRTPLARLIFTVVSGDMYIDYFHVLVNDVSAASNGAVPDDSFAAEHLLANTYSFGHRDGVALTRMNLRPYLPVVAPPDPGRALTTSPLGKALARLAPWIDWTPGSSSARFNPVTAPFMYESVLPNMTWMTLTDSTRIPLVKALGSWPSDGNGLVVLGSKDKPTITATGRPVVTDGEVQGDQLRVDGTSLTTDGGTVEGGPQALLEAMDRAGLPEVNLKMGAAASLKLSRSGVSLAATFLLAGQVQAPLVLGSDAAGVGLVRTYAPWDGDASLAKVNAKVWGLSDEAAERMWKASGGVARGKAKAVLFKGRWNDVQVGLSWEPVRVEYFSGLELSTSLEQFRANLIRDNPAGEVELYRGAGLESIY